MNCMSYLEYLEFEKQTFDNSVLHGKNGKKLHSKKEIRTHKFVFFFICYNLACILQNQRKRVTLYNLQFNLQMPNFNSLFKKHRSFINCNKHQQSCLL